LAFGNLVFGNLAFGNLAFGNLVFGNLATCNLILQRSPKDLRNRNPSNNAPAFLVRRVFTDDKKKKCAESCRKNKLLIDFFVDSSEFENQTLADQKNRFVSIFIEKS
jgi:hypothetical protein